MVDSQVEFYVCLKLSNGFIEESRIKKKNRWSQSHLLSADSYTWGSNHHRKQFCGPQSPFKLENLTWNISWKVNNTIYSKKLSQKKFRSDWNSVSQNQMPNLKLGFRFQFSPFNLLRFFNRIGWFSCRILGPFENIINELSDDVIFEKVEN